MKTSNIPLTVPKFHFLRVCAQMHKWTIKKTNVNSKNVGGRVTQTNMNLEIIIYESSSL